MTSRFLQGFRLALVVWLAMVAWSAHAVIEIAPLSTEDLEVRYRELIEELRCPKCQNQNLADSNSPIAADLREQVRVLLEEGKSDDEIVAFLVDRYGDFVRYKPALNANTAVLWFAPMALLVLGIVVVFFVVRAYRRTAVTAGELSEQERARLAELLGQTSSVAKSEDGGISDK
jgi:cytochrome c-type biogenesis protein CcmH